MSQPPVPKKFIGSNMDLEEILTSPMLFEILLKASEKEFSSENPLFLMAVRHYRSLAQTHKLKALAIPISAIRGGGWIPHAHLGSQSSMGKYIYDKFVAVTAPMSINISDEQRLALTRIATAPGSPFKPDDFNDAYLEISRLINRDTRKRL